MVSLGAVNVPSTSNNNKVFDLALDIAAILLITFSENKLGFKYNSNSSEAYLLLPFTLFHCYCFCLCTVVPSFLSWSWLYRCATSFSIEIYLSENLMKLKTTHHHAPNKILCLSCQLQQITTFLPTHHRYYLTSVHLYSCTMYTIVQQNTILDHTHKHNTTEHALKEWTYASE